jgi:hypothetical protein
MASTTITIPGRTDIVETGANRTRLAIQHLWDAATAPTQPADDRWPLGDV